MSAHEPAHRSPSSRSGPAPILQPSEPKRADNASRALIGIILGGFVLRLIHLGEQSLWYDEAVSVFLAGQRTTQLIGHTARDIHPPGYYLLLRTWLTTTGYPTGHADPTGMGLEYIAATLSLSFGLVLIPLSWQMALRLGLGRKVALMSALLVAVSPFGIWYSQEVRMYTLGASLGVVCVLASIPFLAVFPSPRRLRRAAIVYGLTAAAGLYTLYYFAFLLVALNLAVIALLAWRWLGVAGRGQADPAGPPDKSKEKRRIPTGQPLSMGSRLALWLAAQAGTLFLYLPWLPVAWRQASDPPVPPWRTATRLADTLLEGWSALSFGQSASPTRFWPLLILVAALVLLGVVATLRWGRRSKRQTVSRNDEKCSRPPPPVSAITLLLAAALGPGLLILLASQITPLYHVRYLFTFSPAFGVLIALGLVTLSRWRSPVGTWMMVASVILLLLGSAVSLRAFWTDPQYVADDNRTAVRELALRWRPGDAILVNAGYVYPVLLTYWPGDVAWNGRLSQYDPDPASSPGLAENALILQVGHIDGDQSLGWGDPRSDFYALPLSEMEDAMARVETGHDRLWHYRIYDTVNDPTGAMRAELANNWTQVDDRLYAGEASLRVQGFQSAPVPVMNDERPTTVVFDDWLVLDFLAGQLPATVESGATVDLPKASWSRISPDSGRPAALSFRLVDEAGEVWAATDEPLGGNLLDLQSTDRLVQPLHLQVPGGTPPGTYDLKLIVYDPNTGEPMPTVEGPAVKLGEVQVLKPSTWEMLDHSLADFGPLQLTKASTAAVAVSPGDTIPLDLTWQATSDFDGKAYVLVIQLLDSEEQVVASMEAEPLQGRYPSSAWQVGEVVRDRQQLAVPLEAPAGVYRLVIGVYEADSGQRLETGGRLFGPRSRDYTEVTQIQVR